VAGGYGVGLGENQGPLTVLVGFGTT